MNIVDRIKTEVPAAVTDYEVKTTRWCLDMMKRQAMLQGAQMLMDEVYRGITARLQNGRKFEVVAVQPLRDFMDAERKKHAR